MKALKTFFVPSSPPSTKTSSCDYCKKRFKPACPGQLYCSVECARKQEWDAFHAEYNRKRSMSRASPPDNKSLVRRAVAESAARHGTHPAPQAHAYRGSSLDTEFGVQVPGDPPGLARNRSMPERSRRRAGSHYHTPQKPLPKPPTASSPGRTPGHALRPLVLPDEQYSSRSESSSPRSERRYRRTGTDDRSAASSPTLWTSSPTSSSPTFPAYSPTAPRHRDGARTSPLSASPPRDPSALSRVGRHNKSASDLLSLASSASPGSPASHHHAFPSMVPDGQYAAHSNALGLAVKPFLVRTPSHPPSRANRKQTLDADPDAPPVPTPLRRPGPGGGAPQQQHHPRYRNGTLELRPGYGRREPRPRSNSFGGFLSLKTPLF